MDNQKMAQLIAELRKEKKLTQKELAKELGVTDKAVSKWERALSCPDIALLAPLADILGITTSELLSGERAETAEPEMETLVETTLIYADETTKKKLYNFHRISGIVLTALSLIAIITCTICDMTISGGLTWSLLTICCIVFGWAIIMPVLTIHKKGVFYSADKYMGCAFIQFFPMLHAAALLPLTDTVTAEMCCLFILLPGNCFKVPLIQSRTCHQTFYHVPRSASLTDILKSAARSASWRRHRYN